MKKYSLWLEGIKSKELKAVEKDMDVDIAIVGGGITGLSTLYNLRNSKKKVVLLESDICGRGVTSKSTAKITPLQQDLYINIRKYSEATARKYLKSQIEGRDLLVNTIKKEEIDCDLEKSESYTFTKDKSKERDILEEYEFLKGTLECELYENEDDGTTAVKIKDAYVFHPVKYMEGLKNKLSDFIYENSKVSSIEKRDEFYELSVNGHTVKAKYVVIATHYPYFFKSFFLPLKSHIEVSYVAARKVSEFKAYNAINLEKPTVSLRYHRYSDANYLININRSEKSSNIENIEDNFDDLVSDGEVDFIWSNNDIMTGDFIPYVGRVKSLDDSFLIATGYNTWGMTNSAISGKVLADIIEKRENEYVELFDPNRKIKLGKIVNFPLNIASNVKSFLKGNSSNQNNREVEYSLIDGVEVATVMDEDGVKHTVKARCPHMGCGLIFNKVEGTWDCLCHGSRFDIDGNVIEGPSNKNIKL